MENNTQVQAVTESNVAQVLAEIQSAFYDIPFENSQFQTEAFVVASQITPERAYRSIGLRMHSKIQAILEAKHGRAKEEIDIEELQAKIDNPNTSDFDRRRAQLDISYKLANRPYTDKLMNDAIAELNILYKHFQQLPRYSRAQFENGERIHFTERLNRQVQGVQGAQESLINMNNDLPTIQDFESRVASVGVEAATKLLG
jgi:hypothetical protein